MTLSGGVLTRISFTSTSQNGSELSVSDDRMAEEGKCVCDLASGFYLCEWIHATVGL